MLRNEVKAKLAEGKIVFGSFAHIASTKVVDAFGAAGLDYVRMDPYHEAYTDQILSDMTRAAYSYGLTPWARTRNDPWEIMHVLDMGVQCVTVPNVGTVADAERAARAARYPPIGEREFHRNPRFYGMSPQEYLDWVAAEVWVSCQIEGTDGLANYRDIVKVDGIDVIQTGRGDLSAALGIPGGEFHPKVLALEAAIVDAALAAGKQVQLHAPLTAQGIEYIHKQRERGVRIFGLDLDIAVMIRGYRDALATLRPS